LKNHRTTSVVARAHFWIRSRQTSPKCSGTTPRPRRRILENLHARGYQGRITILKDYLKEDSDKQNARIEHDKALARVMTAVLKDDTELFKQFSDYESFRRWLLDTVFGVTYEADDLPAA
jgi:hypothetical protein